MMLKNERPLVFALHLFWIIPFELGIVLYALFRERKTLRAISAIRKFAPRMLAKRRVLMDRSSVDFRTARAWFGRTR
jgi:hypothetical protein